MFKISYTIIHNRGCASAVTFNRSAKKAMSAAKCQAWAAYECSDATNWADVWLTITNPYGKVVYNDFESAI